jgi:hypothetical protein
MATEFAPTIESWYQDEEMGRPFRVVAVDDDNETIEVQYFNGDIGELDFNAWRDSLIVPIEAPEDASAPFDDVELDDLGYSDTDRHAPGDLTLDDLLDNTDAY